MAAAIILIFICGASKALPGQIDQFQDIISISVAGTYFSGLLSIIVSTTDSIPSLSFFISWVTLTGLLFSLGWPCCGVRSAPLSLTRHQQPNTHAVPVISALWAPILFENFRVLIISAVVLCCCSLLLFSSVVLFCCSLLLLVGVFVLQFVLFLLVRTPRTLDVFKSNKSLRLRQLIV